MTIIALIQSLTTVKLLWYVLWHWCFVVVALSFKDNGFFNNTFKFYLINLSEILTQLLFAYNKGRN